MVISLAGIILEPSQTFELSDFKNIALNNQGHRNVKE
jgi:hypothetical protein